MNAAGLAARVDLRSYVDREERFVGLLQLSPHRWLNRRWLTDRRDRSIASALDPLWRTDPHTWSNPSIDEGRMHGSIARVGWTRADFGEPMLGQPSTAFGGALGGDREFYAGGGAPARRVPSPVQGIELKSPPPPAKVRARCLPDLGGSSTRGLSAALVGATSFVTRVDFSAIDPALVEHSRRAFARLQPVLFADLGAVWNERGWTGVSTPLASRRLAVRLASASNGTSTPSCSPIASTGLAGPIVPARPDARLPRPPR
ncbi:MAG: hypothetical protein R3E12_12175 [Candidatus Eisenbacteria bacterium]